MPSSQSSKALELAATCLFTNKGKGSIVELNYYKSTALRMKEVKMSKWRIGLSKIKLL